MKKILVLDDVKENLIAIKETLEDLIPGCLVLTAQSGKEGLKIARTEQPDTILTDIQMPGMDGFEVCKKLNEDEATKHIPVMIFTGSTTDSETRIKCLEVGAEVFLSKPIDAAELTAQINVLLRIKEAEDKLREERGLLDEKVKERTKELQRANIRLEQDITERKRAEEALQESEERFRAQYQGSPIPTFTWKGTGEDFVLVGYNNAAIAMTHEQSNKYLKKIAHEMYQNRHEILEDLHRCLTEKTIIRKELISQHFLPGKYIITNYAFVPPDLVMVHVIDITEQKQAEKIQRALYDISNALNTTDKMRDFYSKIREYLGNVIDTTNFYVALYDEKTDTISLPFEVSEKDKFETFPAGKTLTSLVIKTGKPLFANKQLQDELAKQGKIDIIGTRSEIWLGVPLKVENKVIDVIAVQSYDDPNLYTEKDIEILTFISEEIALAINRKQAEEQMKRDLKEKELLLREIHHRVKNNLQVISSLLQLQQNEITTKEDAIKGFAASQDRILAMAKAYELLLGSEYMSEVSVGKYIESLAEQLKYNYDIHHKVKISYSLEELTISIKILDRLGLILNEIITNSIKYAFAGRDKGNIHIELKEAEKHVVIKISDDGIGIPEDIDMTNPDTLGLSIVDMITQQLQGTLKLDRKNGTSFKLEIPKEI